MIRALLTLARDPYSLRALTIGVSARATRRLLDDILGPHCRYRCGERVWANDVADHERHEHAGDEYEARLR